MTSSAPQASTYTLPVPDEAVDAVRTLLREPYGELTADVTAEHVRAISAPVVAGVLRGEIRRIRDEAAEYHEAGDEAGHVMDGVANTLVDLANRIDDQAVADEIDGGAS